MLHRLVLIPVIVSIVGCAPLVSKRRRTLEDPQPIARAEPPLAPPPVAPPPPPPVALPPPEPEPEPETVVREEIETPPVEENVEPAPAPVERTTFYAFSDKEIQKLKIRSKKFRDLHAKHKKCAARTEKLIVKREQLREEIIELQNRESRTSTEEKRLASLRAEERRMKNDRKSLASCEPLEKKLTEMLREEYGATASLEEPIY